MPPPTHATAAIECAQRAASRAASVIAGGMVGERGAFGNAVRHPPLTRRPSERVRWSVTVRAPLWACLGARQGAGVECLTMSQDVPHGVDAAAQPTPAHGTRRSGAKVTTPDGEQPDRVSMRRTPDIPCILAAGIAGAGVRRVRTMDRRLRRCVDGRRRVVSLGRVRDVQDGEGGALAGWDTVRGARLLQAAPLP